jgi:hypothetical protein
MPEMIAAGELAGGFIFGLNLLLTCRFLDMNHNDAFSAMRLDSHRHFLRMKIDGDELTIYPIGLDRVPARNEWKESSPTAVGSKLEPPDRPEFQPRLIEPPIVVRMHRVPPVTSTVDADVVASKDPAG